MSINAPPLWLFNYLKPKPRPFLTAIKASAFAHRAHSYQNFWILLFSSHSHFIIQRFHSVFSFQCFNLLWISISSFLFPSFILDSNLLILNFDSTILTFNSNNFNSNFFANYGGRKAILQFNWKLLLVPSAYRVQRSKAKSSPTKKEPVVERRLSSIN